jgi:hypothetical protein
LIGSLSALFLETASVPSVKPCSRQSTFGHKVISYFGQDFAGFFFEKATVVGFSFEKSTVWSTFETIVDSMVNFLEKSQLLQDLGSAT